MITTKLSSTRKLEKPKAFACNNPYRKARIFVSMVKPWLVGLENAFNTLPQWSVINSPIPNCHGLPKEHPSKFSLVKPTNGGSHSQGDSLVNLVVLQTRF